MILVRLAAFALWAVAFLASLAAFVYLIGFIGNRYAFSTIDSGLQLPTWEAARKDVVLLLLFALQHSGMARRVPRTVYLFATAAVLALIYLKWEPMPEFVWHFEIRWPFEILFWLGWALVLASAALLHPMYTFGGRQAWAFLRGVPSGVPEFKTPGPYQYIRHPMMLGLLLAFWSTNEMSRGHLLFASMMTVYILIALRWEEKALSKEFGAQYAGYRKRTRMLI